VLREGFVSTRQGVEEIEEVAIGYGAFLETILDFLIVGFTIFLVIKFMNRFRRKAQDPKNKTVETPKDIQLLSDLTELVREQNQLLKKGTGKS
jgi:large conductance mechanosensitive channel